VSLTAIADPKVLAAARRMLSDLGKPDAAAISVADASAITDAFATTVLTGDGVVIPSRGDRGGRAARVEEVIACVGSVDGSQRQAGRRTAAKADLFFADVDRRAAWLARGKDPALNPLGPATAAAAPRWRRCGSKIEDYFVRCQVAAYDPRGADALAGQEAALIGLAQRALTGTDRSSRS
jgi:hypothetical protein